MDYLVHSADGRLFLAHHGVKGMKWGVRRYQNEDGSYTELGKKRMLKRLAGSGKVTIRKGTHMYRVSTVNTDEATEGNRLYVTADSGEAGKYATNLLGDGRIVNNGKTFAAKYKNNRDIVIPSIRKQTKMELDLLKDPEVRREIVNSLVEKGLSREQAAKEVKAFNAGAEFAKAVAVTAVATPLVGPFSPMYGAMLYYGNKNKKLQLLRVSVGDKKFAKTGEAFEKKLRDKGYNAFRDTNDRNNSLNAKSAIVLLNPEKTVRMTANKEIDRETYAQLYANGQMSIKSNKKNAYREDFVEDGRKRFDKLQDAYALRKTAKEEQEEKLKKARENVKK